MKDKVLILNGSHSELTLIEELKKLGKYVIATGNISDAYGNQYVDEYVRADYSDMEKILDIAREKQITGVVSCANDFGIITASYIAEKMNLKGHDSYETTVLLHQKDLFKEFALSNKMQVPFSQKFESFDEALEYKEKLNYPVIVKPVDLTGGKGVSKVENSKQYESAIRLAFERSRKKVVVVEQYIEGTYHSFSTFLVDKKVIAWFSDNEYSNVYRFFVDTSAGPADYIDEVKDILIKQAEIAAEKLNLVNGIFHMQYVMDENHVPYVIDITRRCSGDIYPEPVEHSTGIPWSKWIVMSELGLSSDNFAESGGQTKMCGRHCIMADSEGTIDSVVIDDEIKKYIYKDIQWWKPGDAIRNHYIDKVGIIFYEFPSREEMTNVVNNIKNYVRVNLR